MYLFESLTQKKKVLHVLETVGERGLHSFELINMISHKAPARLCELRKEGYNITSTMEKRGNSYGVRYTLIK